jgi:hypothetical protein
MVNRVGVSRMVTRSLPSTVIVASHTAVHVLSSEAQYVSETTGMRQT